MSTDREHKSDILFLLLSLGAFFGFFFASLWVLSFNSDCDPLVGMTTVLISVFMIVISIASMCGTSCGSKRSQRAWGMVMFVLVTLFLGILTLALVIATTKTTPFVEKMFLGVDGTKWNRIKQCLIRNDICSVYPTICPNLNRSMESSNYYYYSNLDPWMKSSNYQYQYYYPEVPKFDCLQPSEPRFWESCCAPPHECNFVQVGNSSYSTTWTKPAGVVSNSSSAKDCDLWNNDPSTLCLNCDSCKAEIIQSSKDSWFTAFLINIVPNGLMLTGYVLGVFRVYQLSWPGTQFDC